MKVNCVEVRIVNALSEVIHKMSYVRFDLRTREVIIINLSCFKEVNASLLWCYGVLKSSSLS